MWCQDREGKGCKGREGRGFGLGRVRIRGCEGMGLGVRGEGMCWVVSRMRSIGNEVSR